MLCIPEPAERDAFIKGLRDLARYLAAHPDIPVPAYDININLPVDSDQDGGFAQVDQIAEMLGVPVTDETARDGHYKATRTFGSVQYTVVSIPAARMERHYAHMSYRDSVIPDRAPGDAA